MQYFRGHFELSGLAQKMFKPQLLSFISAFEFCPSFCLKNAKTSVEAKFCILTNKKLVIYFWKTFSIEMFELFPEENKESHAGLG